MKTHLIITAIAFGPALLLVGCALWVHFTQPQPLDDFLADQDDWGQP